MRPVTQLLFIFFYLASIFATGQERVTFALEEVEHGIAQSANLQINSGCERPYFPRFREAKKAGFDFGFRPAGASSQSPEASTRDFSLSPVSIESLLLVHKAHSRAPPAL
jgi:hypothetical protein